MKVKIAFPEMENSVVVEALAKTNDVEPVKANSLKEACELVRDGAAQAMVAGIDCASRDVILASREIIGAKGKTFSSCMVMEKAGQKLILADVAACKHPTEDQLFDIVMQTYETAKHELDEDPRIAMLSFSTNGSGGKNEVISKILQVIERVRAANPEILIDGEMQLDAAINGRVAKTKMPESKVAGRANVLICPDLNSGNILYKALEQFDGYTAAGPILQGFNAPVSDLSRGSTAEDVVATINVIRRLCE